MGIRRHDYSSKASATYLHNLTAILADHSSDFTPRTFDYRFARQPLILFLHIVDDEPEGRLCVGKFGGVFEDDGGFVVSYFEGNHAHS